MKCSGKLHFQWFQQWLRSSVNAVIETYATDSNYGVHAAMSWIYLGVVAVFLLVVLGILSKVVFYYDDKK